MKDYVFFGIFCIITQPGGYLLLFYQSYQNRLKSTVLKEINDFFGGQNQNYYKFNTSIFTN
jgi:hypothetical protein